MEIVWTVKLICLGLLGLLSAVLQCTVLQADSGNSVHSQSSS